MILCRNNLGAALKATWFARPLLTPIELESWAHPDLLSNTVVQAMVKGKVSPSRQLCSLKVGSKEPTIWPWSCRRRHAISRCGARSGSSVRARPLTWGKLIFQWHTLVLPATNLSATTRCNMTPDALLFNYVAVLWGETLNGINTSLTNVLNTSLTVGLGCGVKASVASWNGAAQANCQPARA